MKRLALLLAFSLTLSACALFKAPNSPANAAQDAQTAISAGLTALNDAGVVAVQITKDVATLHDQCQPAPGVCLVSDAQFQAFSDGFRAVRDKVDLVVTDAQSASATVSSVQASIQAVLDEIVKWFKSLGTITPVIASEQASLQSRVGNAKAVVGGGK